MRFHDFFLSNLNNYYLRKFSNIARKEADQSLMVEGWRHPVIKMCYTNASRLQSLLSVNGCRLSIRFEILTRTRNTFLFFLFISICLLLTDENLFYCSRRLDIADLLQKIMFDKIPMFFFIYLCLTRKQRY